MRTKLFLRAVGCSAIVAVASLAHGTEPLLNRLEPQGGQRGTEVSVAAIGARLGDGPHQVLFHEPGIEVKGVEVVDGKQVKLALAIADDCPLGRHALRLRTATGLSNLLTFHVGTLEEIVEAEPNNDRDAAQEIALGVVINGLVQPQDVDVYAVEVTEGERLSIEIEGLRLGRMLFDPLIEIYDDQGTRLVRSDDCLATRQDAFVSVLAPSTGRLLIHVRESAYRGDHKATYRLHVGRFPRPRAVYPPVAVIGQTTEMNWIGDPLGDLAQTVEETVTDARTIDVFPKDDQGIAPSALPLLAVESPPTLEVEPNNKLAEATEFAVPGVVCGVVEKRGDLDHFRFSAKKGQVWDVRVWARQLRSPLDANIRILDAKGKILAGNDDDRGQPDSYLRFKPPADGEYLFYINDRVSRGSPEMVYAVEFTPPALIADLKLQEHRRFEARVLEVPQGGRTATLLTVSRRDFGGVVQPKVTNLLEGVSLDAPVSVGNFHLVPIVLEATDEAPLGATLAPVTVELTENPRPLESRFRQQTWLVRGRNNVTFWNYFSKRAAVAVTERLPFSIRLQPPRAPLVQGGEKKLKVIAQRDEGFDAPIRVRMLYNPPGCSANASLSIAKGQNEAVIPMTANGNARGGEWPIVVLGEAGIGGGRVLVSTPLTPLGIEPPYFNMTVPTLTTQQDAIAKFVIALDQKVAFDGEAELELVRLPPGVTAGKVKVTAESKSAEFQITIGKDVRVGPHRGVACRARLQVNDEPVVYTQGYAELRVDPATTKPPAQTAKNKDKGDATS